MPTEQLFSDLKEKIINHSANIGIIGLGYVGLPLAMEFAKVGFEVTGLDISEEKVKQLNAGKSYIQDVPSKDLAHLTDVGFFKATTAFGYLEDMDVVIIAVPTPLRKTKDPDMSFIVNSCNTMVQYLRPGQLISLESTTYPGTTQELVLPILEGSGLKIGKDFFLCFSPERVDPGNPKYHTKNIPKVVGGVTEACTELGTALYQQALDTIVPVSSTGVAEMVKLLENTFRMINIGLVNELAMMCDRMKINIWEVIDAASTKPFGFMPFYPGPGLGGHCIPIDPFYLSWKSKQAGLEARFIELAGFINAQMPHFVVNKIQDALNNRALPLKNSHIHILGVAYKKDIDDVRESPALDIIHLLEDKGAKITFSDPYVKEIKLGDRILIGSENLFDALWGADCSVIVTDHSQFPYADILSSSELVVDTRNVYKNSKSPKIVRL